MSFCIVASCTPCVGPTAAGVDQIRREAASDTSSGCGHRVILMRRRSSVTSASGKLTWNDRIAVLSGMACSYGVWVERDRSGVPGGDGAGNSDATELAAVSFRPSHRVIWPRAVASGIVRFVAIAGCATAFPGAVIDASDSGTNGSRRPVIVRLLTRSGPCTDGADSRGTNGVAS